MSPQIWKIGEENCFRNKGKGKYNNSGFYVQAVFGYFQIAVYY